MYNCNLFWTVMALAAAAGGCNQSGSFELQQGPADPLPNSVSGAPVSAAIVSPQDGDVIMNDVYDSVEFSVDEVAASTDFWVFVRDRYNFYVQNPPPSMNSRRNLFVQRNLRCNSDGEWEIHLATATREASRRLEDCMQRGQWAFPRLPDGVESVDFVVVERSGAGR